MERTVERPPRVLVATVVDERALTRHLAGWQEALAAIRTALLWDVAIVDGTENAPAGYDERLRAWAHNRPFGPEHRVRLLRYGADVDRRVFTTPRYRREWRRQLLMGKSAGWASYELMMPVSIEARPAPSALQMLFAADLPWASADDGSGVPNLDCALLKRELTKRVSYQVSDDPRAFEGAAREAGFLPLVVPGARFSRADERSREEASCQ